MAHRVFIGLTEVAGYFSSLRRGLEEAGIPATFIDESQDPFAYAGASRPFPSLNRSALRGRRLLADPSTGAAKRAQLTVAATLLRGLRGAYRVGLLVWAVARHDVFVFGGEQSFLPGHIDLALLRLLRKRVIWIFTGSDHRPPYLNGRYLRAAAAAGNYRALAIRTSTVRRRIAKVERHAVTIGHKASAQFHTRPFINVQCIGVPLWRDLPGVESSPSKAVRVLHAPSDPISKGTDDVRRAIGAIRDRGYEIDYTEIIGRPNSEVLKAIAATDLVVDEVFSDSPIATLGAEAALLGKPTVVCGYYAATLAQESRADEVPPTRFCLPEQLEDAIEDLVADAAAREELGRQARAFVRDRWDLPAIARRLLQVVDGTAPEAWWIDPESLTYVHGWGMREDELRSTLRAFVESEGEGALQLAHNPRLLERVRVLADLSAE
jgi:hypothetical protein